jgi:hypothetical protein
VIGTAGVIAYQTLDREKSNPITVQYYVVPNPIEFNITQYELSSYLGWATSIAIDASFSSNKTVSLDCHNFYLTSNGQPLKMLFIDNSTVTIQSGVALFHQLKFEVEGNETSYQLAYHGNNVNLIQSDTSVT